MRSKPEKVITPDREYWTTGLRVGRFMENHCMFTNGRWTGKPFVLQPWQVQILCELFEVDGDGKRKYRRALIGTPRKAGKTELAAALGLYLALADNEQSAEVVCAASSEEQADRVFEAAMRMAEGDGLRHHVRRGITAGRRKAIISKADGQSMLSRLTSRGGSKHGLNIHAAILDEVHVWTSDQHSELWAALMTGIAAREEPMIVAITTAGEQLEGTLCGQMYQAGLEIKDGSEENGFFFRWWGADEEDDWRDPEVWRKANPSFGVTVDENFLRDEMGSIPETSFRRLYLNQWVSASESSWLPEGAWEACAGECELDVGRPVYVGVDLSESRDSTAVCIAQWQQKGERLAMKWRLWERPNDPMIGRDRKWRAPYAEVENYLQELAKTYKVMEFDFDPWGGRSIIQRMEAEGHNVVSVWSGGQRRIGATAAYYELIERGIILHDGNPRVNRHHMDCGTVEALTGPSKRDRHGYYLTKRGNSMKIDAASAAVHAVYGVIYGPRAEEGPIPIFFPEPVERPKS